jgi:hypothetical protein
MGDPEQPRKGRFQPGNKFGRGRVRGSENKFGPNLREKLLAGIARSGERKAKRAGVNGKVDGTAFFIETLMENTAAASALLSKLIPPPEQPEKPAGPAIVVNVSPVAEGQQFAPGHKVLLPFDEAGKAWAAHNGGAETWATYLQEIEPQLTKAAFENLRQVVPSERETLMLRDHAPLRLVRPDDVNEVTAAPDELEFEPQTERERRLLAELEALSPEQLMERARQAGFVDVDSV